MDDKIIIISPIYHDNITYVTNAGVSIIDINNDDAQIFTEAFPVVERESITQRNCFYSYTKTMITCCCATVVCFVFFLFIGGAELLFN